MRPDHARGLVEHLFRHSAGPITAALCRNLGPSRIDIAEECLQDAMLQALRVWPHEGLPDNPRGWLYRVARNRAVDLVRRDDVLRDKLPLLVDGAPADGFRGDDELALMFLCCHPGLPAASRVALTLKVVGGLSVDEIATALLSKPATVAQRIVRAKQWMRANAAPFEVPPPERLESRVDSLLSVLYLMFNAGYEASDGDTAVRRELCAESIRLCRLLVADPRTDLPKVRALLALMLLHASRLHARTDDAGDLLLLSDQDRRSWDHAMIAEGVRTFADSCTGDARSVYHVEAAIAACHAAASDATHTDWSRIVSLYDELLAIRPSPVAALNRAIATAMTDRLDEALTWLEELRDEPALAEYHLLPAALGALYLRSGDRESAAHHYREALSRRCSEPERRFLHRQLDLCTA
ncbi:RNA polymerase sigma-70 factor (ECF subfamily) [Herbihabitans rhizosphaerae]|uniref:RNA polymerase sigma-70 factor (ECF subfamily) n=1 Tax=Herbihabitans rhizosphaerae TaxID=1872711 RepID=A0A4Q7KP43_9PSEU|nr:DUF6596 domain-containing protein [Herbihabitans rhizosphaerae]RZS37750.1 RNA polymerase sigma-70 factor (ECF subfamily) [Herbihabitans rhizosphaerae]